MKKVKVFTYVPHETKRGINKRVFDFEGVFHQFGVSYEEFDTGAGNYSTAIVEKSDGSIVNVSVEEIQFIVPTV